MANEITVSAALTARKGVVQVSSGALAKSLNMSGSDMSQTTQQISNTADSALDMGAITGVPAYVLVANTDATNFVELSLDTGASFAAKKFSKLLPGEVLLLPPSQASIYAKADTAPVTVFVVAVEA